MKSKVATVLACFACWILGVCVGRWEQGNALVRQAEDVAQTAAEVRKYSDKNNEIANRIADLTSKLEERKKSLDERERSVHAREVELAMVPQFAEAINRYVSSEVFERGVKITIDAASNSDETTKIIVTGADHEEAIENFVPTQNP